MSLTVTVRMNFYPRPPRGGRRYTRTLCALKFANFYPRPPRGGRPPSAILVVGYLNFYPRPPRGGRLSSVIRHTSRRLFLSTPSARRATDPARNQFLYKEISIHALREEGDRDPRGLLSGDADFYPRPPRGGRPASDGCKKCTGEISIHALREEGDSIATTLLGKAAGISIHALREEGDLTNFSKPEDLVKISIHALREEGDNNILDLLNKYKKFLSTPSARRATHQ